MTPQQILLIQESFATLAPDAEIVADIFYNRLFALDQSLQSMFRVDLSEQKRKLMAMLEFAVGTLERMDTLVPALENLGRRHSGYGVRDEHYHIVGEALLGALREFFGKRFDCETETAWTEMFAVVANAMQRATDKFSAAKTEAQTAVFV